MGVFDIVRRDRNTAFSLWHAIKGLFQDNELQRAVYLEAELRSLQQGDMSINDYCTKLKRLADQLRDIGHPVSEPSQPVITSKSPSHNFMSARSFLLLEELSFQHDTNAEAGQALAATHGERSNGSSSSAAAGTNDDSLASNVPRSNNCSNNGGGNRSNNRSDRRRGHDNGGGSSRSSNNSSVPWAVDYNPWQGMVQA
ncbi:uncharacterized protein [Miscanthus floridulus]|uniref:uncharacterized protein n=1 Tax=Miscanthus floridulus TaxID=154761 RepID=UPI0034577FFF